MDTGLIDFFKYHLTQLRYLHLKVPKMKHEYFVVGSSYKEQRNANQIFVLS